MKSFQITKIEDGKTKYMTWNGWGATFWLDRPTSVGADNIDQLKCFYKQDGDISIKQVGKSDDKDINGWVSV